MSRGTDFRARYGPWALVAGASEGIGAAFATALSERGLAVVAVARREAPLHALVKALPTEVVPVAADLATPDGLDAVRRATDRREIGLVVANAAYSPIGSFTAIDPADLARALDVNCRAPMLLAREYLPAMVARGRGGLVIMSSLAGQQGSARIATYAATKAFGAVLAEGLWAELRDSGVDVIACLAGAVATPNLGRAMSGRAPGTVDPATVAEATLRDLGRRSRTVPGALMKVSTVLMGRVLPRRIAVRMMSNASANLQSPDLPG